MNQRKTTATVVVRQVFDNICSAFEPIKVTSRSSGVFFKMPDCWQTNEEGEYGFRPETALAIAKALEEAAKELEKQ